MKDSSERSFVSVVILLTGFLLGLEQMGLLFALQGQLSSSVVTYFAVTLAWLIGIVVGLALPVSWPLAGLLVAGLVAYYTILFLVNGVPFDLRWLPVYGLLTICTGAFAGSFFRQLDRAVRNPRRLFFVENNGFVLGLIVAVVGLMWFGIRAAVVAPAAAASILVWLGFPEWKEIERS